MAKRQHRIRVKRSNPELFQENLINEEWKEVAGYEGRFEVSNTGRVRTIARFVKRKTIPHHKPSFLKRQRVTHTGYVTVYLSINKKYKHLFVHRLVASHFVGERPSDKHFVNHKDGNKQNNHYSNLEWVTPSENIKHAFRTGLMCQDGERHPSNKLTNKQVMEIINSNLSDAALAKKYNVSAGNIWSIRVGKTWSSVTGIKYKSNDSKSSTMQSSS